DTDHDRQICRLTYSQYNDTAHPLASSLQQAVFSSGDRATIIMTNQSKWLISAYAVFYAGGVLVPLDYKLTPAEHLALLAHSKARVLIVEYHLWRAITQGEGFPGLRAETVLVTETPPNAEFAGACRWEEFRSEREPGFVPRARRDWAA